MFFDVHLIEDLHDLAFSVDQKRRSLDAHVLFTVHRFFHPDAVFLHDVLFSVGQKVESKVVFRPEFLMRLFAVGGNAEQLDILFVEDVVRVTERTNLERSARRVVFRVEKQHDTPALKIGKLYRISILVLAFEMGCLIAFFEHSFRKIDIVWIVAKSEPPA